MSYFHCLHVQAFLPFKEGEEPGWWTATVTKSKGEVSKQREREREREKCSLGVVGNVCLFVGGKPNVSPLFITSSTLLYACLGSWYSVSIR